MRTPLHNVGDYTIIRGFSPLTTIIQLFCLPHSHTELDGAAVVGIFHQLSPLKVSSFSSKLNCTCSQGHLSVSRPVCPLAAWATRQQSSVQVIIRRYLAP